jgi:hypothetical protein
VTSGSFPRDLLNNCEPSVEDDGWRNLAGGSNSPAAVATIADGVRDGKRNLA